MSKSNSNPADPFKKALAEATKSLANEPELNISFTVDPPGVSSETVRLPQVSRNLTRDEVQIILDGGSVNVKCQEDGVWISGNIEYVFSGKISSFLFDKSE